MSKINLNNFQTHLTTTMGKTKIASTPVWYYTIWLPLAGAHFFL